MIYQSPLPPLDIPETSVLDFFYPVNENPSDEQLWIDGQDPSLSLSPKTARNWICRLGLGLERRGVKVGDVVMVSRRVNLILMMIWWY
jgi:4-coumarate--CoA ligase